MESCLSVDVLWVKNDSLPCGDIQRRGYGRIRGAGEDDVAAWEVIRKPMQANDDRAEIGFKSRLSFHHFRNKKNKGSKGPLVLINIGGPQSLGASVEIMSCSPKQCVCAAKAPRPLRLSGCCYRWHWVPRTLRIRDSPATPQVVSCLKKNLISSWSWNHTFQE